jgi:hypothetical protein
MKYERRTVTFIINEQGQQKVLRQAVPFDKKKLVSVRISTEEVPDNVLANSFAFGVGAAGQDTPAFVSTLTFQNILRPSFELTANAGEKIYVTRPVRYGKPRISINGFVGGFTYRTLSFNDEDYYLFESVNENLGYTNVTLIG